MQRIASEARTAQGLPDRELRPAHRDSGVNMQGPRVVRQEVLRSAQPMTRSSGSGSSFGPAVGESKVMGLASKLRDLIHLAEFATNKSSNDLRSYLEVVSQND